jgi:hypothetical protein
MVPGAAPQNAPAPGGGGGGGAGNRRKPGVIAAIAGAAALLLILCIGGGVFLVNNLGGDDKPDDKPTATATGAAPTGETETVDCDGMRGKQFAGVRNHLESVDGFKVKQTDVADNSPRGTVVEVSPCGEQPKGSEIEVKVSTGRSGGGGGQSGGPDPTCTGGFPFNNCQSRR